MQTNKWSNNLMNGHIAILSPLMAVNGFIRPCICFLRPMNQPPSGTLIGSAVFAYTAAKALNAYHWSGQLPKIAHSPWGITPVTTSKIKWAIRWPTMSTEGIQGNCSIAKQGHSFTIPCLVVLCVIQQTWQPFRAYHAAFLIGHNKPRKLQFKAVRFWWTHEFKLIKDQHSADLNWPSAPVVAFDDDVGPLSLGRGDATGGRGWLRVRPSEFLFADSKSPSSDTPSNGKAAKATN